MTVVDVHKSASMWT